MKDDQSIMMSGYDNDSSPAEKSVRRNGLHKCNNAETYQQTFNNYSNYYYFLVNQNREAIERLIQQLQQNALLHQNLIKILKKCLMGRIATFSIIPDEIFKDLLSIMREKIQSYKKRLRQDQLSFYQSVLKDSIRLSQSIKKQRNIIQEWTIQKLYYLDILSIFFRQGMDLLQNCNCKFISLTKKVINYLVGFSHNQITKLIKIYKDSHMFIREIKKRNIQQLVNIYDILILRNRMFFCVAKAGRHKIDQTQYAQNIPIYPKKNLQEEDLNDQYAYYYNFCQIAFWSTQKHFQQQPYARKIEILQQLQKINLQKDARPLSQALLSFKIIQNISFRSIFKLLNFIVKKQQKEIRSLIQQPKQTKTKELQAYFPYIFIKDEPFEVAFEKSGLSKRFDLKNFDRFLPSKHQAIISFVSVAFKQARKLSVLLHNMLKMQLNHKRELIVMKKMVISFSEIAGIPKESTPNQGQELICNLILITSQDRILSSCIVRDVLKDQKYMRILKRLLNHLHFKPESAILLYQNYIGQSPQQRPLLRFYFHVIKTYRVRLYLMNAPLYCKLVLLTFSYIKMQILSRRVQITRQNFYEIVEAQITSTLNLLTRLSFQFIN